MVDVKIINRSTNPLPAYATEGSAGMDLRANLKEKVVLAPGRGALIPTGLYISLPMGYEARIQSRSGLAYKSGVIVLNSPGCIDSDYRGEIGVILMNLSTEFFEVNNGDRIAQMIISEYSKVNFIPVETLDETERGQGGFGHSGVK